MEEMSTITTLVCCVCGVNIEPNPSYKCIACIKTEHDMTREVPPEIRILQCRGCERYLDPPDHWVNLGMSSREQLNFCLNKIKGLDKTRLTEAKFLYTEPHSKTLKIQITLQKDVGEGAVLEQEIVIDYVISNQFCMDCHRVEAKNYWQAVVQVRQKVNHKRTLYYLEQLMMKSGITKNATVKVLDSGMDLYFTNDFDAERVSKFIEKVVVCSKMVESKKLISHDKKSNIYNSKYSRCVELAPICKDDLVCLPKDLSNKFGGMSRICLVARATNQILLLDPCTAQKYSVNTLTYRKKPFTSFAHSKMMEEFVVMESEESDVKYFPGQGKISYKYTVYDVWVQKPSQVGGEEKFFCKTHLGGVLNIGDTVMGYDLKTCNYNSDEVDNLKDKELPDVVLVKKYYGSKSLRDRKRKWKLNTFTDIKEGDKDYVDFLEDLEDDEKLRKDVNIYVDPSKKNADSATALEGEDPLEEDVPQIDISDMLQELGVADEEEISEEEQMEP